MHAVATHLLEQLDLVDEPLPVCLQTFHRSAACVRQLLARLSGEVRDLGSAGDLRPQLLHLQSRLQIGWGTLRVTLGMSLSAAMYDAFSNLD